jgi:serine/threonine-protein kinase
LVYVHDGTLFAVPFDLKRLETTGQTGPLLEDVATGAGSAGAQLSFSDNGELAYIAGHGGIQTVSLDWMDRDGKFTPIREAPGAYFSPAFSPDGKRLALDIYDGKKDDIWVYEWERNILTRLTFGGDSNKFPLWTPDGQRIVYSSQEKSGPMNIWWIRADGAGSPQRLAQNSTRQIPDSWSPDGKTLTFTEINHGGSDVMTLSMEGSEKSGWKPGEPKALLHGAYYYQSAISPDGRWIAYSSNESGDFEIYVRPFPSTGGKWQISVHGGNMPRWSRSGKELYYRTPDSKIMVAAYTATGDSLHAENPQPWSLGQFTNVGAGISNFDVYPDGKRFVVLKAPNTGPSAALNQVSFVLNFFDEISRKFPSNSR